LQAALRSVGGTGGLRSVAGNALSSCRGESGGVASLLSGSVCTWDNSPRPFIRLQQAHERTEVDHCVDSPKHRWQETEMLKERKSATGSTITRRRVSPRPFSAGDIYNLSSIYITSLHFARSSLDASRDRVGALYPAWAWTDGSQIVLGTSRGWVLQ
jgi:hypothetical protein